MPIVRVRTEGDNDAVIQVKRWWIPEWMGDLAWVDFSTVRSAQNRLANEIISLQKSMKDKLVIWRQLAENANAEVDFIKEIGTNQFGKGISYPMTSKDFRSYAVEYTPTPATDWKSFFSVIVKKEFGLDKLAAQSSHGKGGRHTGRLAKNRTGTTAFLLSEHSDLQQHIRNEYDVDGTLIIREDKNGGKSGSKSVKLNSSQWKEYRGMYPRNEGENQEDWNSRVRSHFAKDGGSQD